MHPLISIYGSTGAVTFPLILMIGREPNTAEAISTDVGLYDFQRHPRCGFWNMSYRMVARAVGMNGAELKRICEQKQASPIIYADALPIGLRNHVRDKHRQRGNVGAAETERHVKAIFAHQSLINRVRLVVVSGLYTSAFGDASEQIAKQCHARSLPLLKVPFFHGVNGKRIEAALTEQDRALIREIIQDFRTSNEDLAARREL